jgi:hypothetical protein
MNMTPANENTGTLAGVSGADVHSIGIVKEDYRKPGRSAMSLYAKDSHKRVCRMLGYALTLDDPVTWNQTAARSRHRPSRSASCGGCTANFWKQRATMRQ